MDQVFQNLSGITLQRLEKPKPKPELQQLPPPKPIPAVPEAESSFENEEEEEESYDEYYETDESEDDIDLHIKNADKLSESVTINKRVTESNIGNDKQGIGESVRIEKLPPKRVIDSGAQSLSDSVTIDRAIPRRVVDTIEVQNVNTAKPAGNKRVIDVSEIQNLKRNLGDSVTLNKPTNDSVSLGKSAANSATFASKRVINVSEIAPIGKQVIDTSDLHSFVRNLTESVNKPKPIINAVEPRSKPADELQKPGVSESASISRVPRSIETEHADDNIMTSESEFDYSDYENSNDSFQDSDTETPTIQKSATGAVTTNRPTPPKSTSDPSIVQESHKQTVAKRVLETSELQSFRQGLPGSISINRRADVGEPVSINRRTDIGGSGLPESISINRRTGTDLSGSPTVAMVTTPNKLVVDTTEIQNLKKSLQDRPVLPKNTLQPPINKQILNTSDLKKFKAGAPPDQPILQKFDSAVTFTKRVVDTSQIHNLKQAFGNSASLIPDAPSDATIQIKNVKQQSQKMNEPVELTQKPAVTKRILDTSQIYRLKQSLTSANDLSKLEPVKQTFSDSVTIAPQDNIKLSPVSKQVVDGNTRQNLNESVTIDRSPSSKPTVTSEETMVNNVVQAKTKPLDFADVYKQSLLASLTANKNIADSYEMQDDANDSATPESDDEEDEESNENPVPESFETNKPDNTQITATPNKETMEFSESTNLKRTLDEPVEPETSPKKIKMTDRETPVTEKPTPEPNASLSDAQTDEELSEYLESDFDSESELDSEMAAIKREAAASFKQEAKEVTNESVDAAFLEKLVDESFLEDKNVPDIPIKTEIDSGDGEDYDYDIKEKLKEMGEISFETVKKGDKPKKSEESEASTSKKGVEDDVVIERKGPGGVISSSMMRRNIREVMDEAKLDESTLAAQREEMERLQRVQEQQRLIRDVQRQMAQERMQNKVLSLLQGGSLTKTGPAGTRIGNTTLVKLPNGELKAMPKSPKQSLDVLKLPKGSASLMKPPQGNMKRSPGATTGPGHLTPSVSIAPVAKKPLSLSRPYSDGEGEYEDPRMLRHFPKSKSPKPSTSTSADATSDDDCIVVSDSEVDQAAEDEIIEDPSNSGMHTNDEFNQPDAMGRVVVNIGHPEGESDIYLAPQIARIIKPHQIGGIRFLYDNVVESINRFDHSTGFGCILAHSMGLGKTLQVISFSDVFLRHTSSKTILCIMPINTLQNWLAEYNMWLPCEEDAAESPLNAQGEVRPRTFGLYVLNDSHKTITSRARVVHAWKTNGGVLLIGYEQYRLLSLRKQPKSRRKPHLVQPEDEDKNKKLLDDIYTALVMPGPDLVICDEGHRIKNSHASISQALKQMRTKRRVVLTGYPLQNNLMEYWCMVDFVRPNYLGSKAEFCNMFERPIQNGQCIDSTENDIKLMRYRAHVLHSLLLGFVQRRSHEVLQNALPQKEEYVLLIRMTDFQRKLYNVFMNEVVRCQSVPNPLKAFAVCCKIWNHPDVLYNFLKKRAGGEAVDIDLEEVSNTSSAIVNAPPATKSKRQSRRSTTPKGRRATKPAASVTPNNTRAQERTPPRTRRSTFLAQNPVPDSSEFFHNENANFPSPSLNNQQSTSCPSSQSSESNFASQSFSQTFSSFSNASQSSNSFQNIKQQLNLCGQKDDSSSFSKNQFLGSDGPSSNSREGLSWRRDDSKTIASSPIKNEQQSSYGSGEIKPKINIISDIKLGNPFSSPLGKSTSDNRKINIISDIKLEIKKEESGDDKRFSKFNMDGMKNEIKPLLPPPRRISEDEDVKIVSEMPPPSKMRGDDGQDGIPYDWALELVKDYMPGCLANSAKTEVLFCILRESITLGDRLLLFSQSLITLDVIEQFLQMNNVPGQTEKWAKNTNYYRLDGSTSALEREKLINEFNSNPKIHLFLVSTRAGSLGINLVGANRVIVFDASWNPCHDTQAVCRVYRYGQQKPCFVYRFVMDNCLEKKIYDRQINKQGMSDRVVDECNPDSHVTMKELSTLCFDDSDETEAKDWSCVKDNYRDSVLQKVLEKYGTCFSKQPFQHESLLVDRKDKQLSLQEKRLAKKGYEREKQASRQPTYNFAAGARSHRPVASVRPMLQGGERPSRWIPAEHWQRQGMTAQEMTLPLDVVIPTNQPDKSNIILKAGQKVLVLKSPKGVYMQLENGKIVAIKTAIKVRGKAEEDAAKLMRPAFPPMKPPPPPLPLPNMPLLPPKRMVRPFTPGHAKLNMRSIRQPVVPNLLARMQNPQQQRMPGPPRKPGPLTKPPMFPMGADAPRPIGLPKQDLESKKGPLPKEITQRLMGNDITMQKYPDKKERRPQTNMEPPQSALLKSIQQKGAISISSRKPQSSTIQQLEQSTSTLISETKQRIHDMYQEEEKASASDSSGAAPIESDDMQDDDIEDIEDLEESYEDEDLPEVVSSDLNADEVKGDGSQNDDYEYDGYYGYNQSYPPPPQGYGSYPPHQPPYEYGYGQTQPPSYNYGMYPQNYPPQPQYSMPPPQPYDPYAPHPPQPVYGGYHPPYPQQYPPPTNSYPPAAPPPVQHNYQDYQYNQSPQNPPPTTNSNYYQNT